MSVEEQHGGSGRQGRHGPVPEAVLDALARARAAGGPAELAAALDLVESTVRAVTVDQDRERDRATGLPSRAAFASELGRQLAEARRHKRAGVLVVLQLHGPDGEDDGFETALTSAAALLAARVRTEDVLGRLGHDRLGVLLRETSLEDATRIAEDMRQRITVLRGAPAETTGSVLRLDPEIPDGDTALLAADLGLVTARAAGGGHVEIANHETLPRFTAEFARDERLIEALGDSARAPSIGGALASVRELLGMQIAYLTRHTDDEQILLRLAGDPAPLRLTADARLPLETTYCQAILDGTLPPLMPDIETVPEAMAMPITEATGIRAFASVPVLLADGQFYGTLCAADQAPRPQLGPRDLQFLHVLARLIAHEIEHDAYLREQHELRVQAAGADALVRAVEARDAYTGAHSRVVVDLAVRVAERLGLSDPATQEVAQVALLHDIGKIAVPDAVLRKPGRLTPEELAEMRKHPEHGERLVSRVLELAHLAPAIRAEHESFDGSGYPDGLRGERIPIASRITLACDAFHAMTSERPYRPAMSRGEAIHELSAHAGTQFCPRSVQALLAVLASRDADV